MAHGVRRLHVGGLGGGGGGGGGGAGQRPRPPPGLGQPRPRAAPACGGDGAGPTFVVGLSPAGAPDPASGCTQALRRPPTPDPDERIAAVGALLAEEARMAMMVGVAVGWALHEELTEPQDPEGED